MLHEEEEPTPDVVPVEDGAILLKAKLLDRPPLTALKPVDKAPHFHDQHRSVSVDEGNKEERSKDLFRSFRSRKSSYKDSKVGNTKPNHTSLFSWV